MCKCRTFWAVKRKGWRSRRSSWDRTCNSRRKIWVIVNIGGFGSMYSLLYLAKDHRFGVQRASQTLLTLRKTRGHALLSQVQHQNRPWVCFQVPLGLRRGWKQTIVHSSKDQFSINKAWQEIPINLTLNHTINKIDLIDWGLRCLIPVLHRHAAPEIHEPLRQGGLDAQAVKESNEQIDIEIIQVTFGLNKELHFPNRRNSSNLILYFIT